MMQIARLKIAAAAVVITAAVSTAGWFTVKQVMGDGASAAAVSAAAPSGSGPAASAAPIAPAGVASPVAAAAPQVVKAVPNDGDTSVDPSATELRVTFDQPMDTRRYSFVGGGPTFPGTGARPHWINQTTITLPIALKPGHSYWLSINSDQFQNFRSASGAPAVPHSISFTT